MRILHVVKDLEFNGAAVVVSTLMNGQHADGHEVACISEGGGLVQATAGEHFGLPPTGRDPRMMVAAVRALRGVIAEFGPDVVHAHNPNIMLVTGLATRRGRRVPSVVTLHGSPPGQYRLNVAAARVAGLPMIACGPAVAALMSQHGHPVQATILNGVRVAARADPATVRAGLGLGPADFAFVQVGRLAPQKDPVLAVEALHACGCEQARLFFAGSGELAGAVRARARHLGVAQRVVLLGERRDAHDLMRACDAVLLSSRWEGHPLVVLEALRLGRPVVTTRVSGIRELLHDGVDSVVCDPTPESLGAGMRRLVQDPGLRATIAAGAAARDTELSPTVMVQQYEQVYGATIAAATRA